MSQVEGHPGKVAGRKRSGQRDVPEWGRESWQPSRTSRGGHRADRRCCPAPPPPRSRSCEKGRALLGAEKTGGGGGGQQPQRGTGPEEALTPGAELQRPHSFPAVTLSRGTVAKETAWKAEP